MGRVSTNVSKTKGTQDTKDGTGLLLVEDYAQSADQRRPEAGSKQGHGLEKDSPATCSAPNLRGKHDTTPAPGQYVWRDDVHLRKKPVWSMMSPDRRNLDLMLGTWTPASRSLQPRAPDPGEYGAVDRCGRNGVFTSPKWSQARSSGRPCLAQDPPEVIEIENKLPSSFGGENLLHAWPPKWSVFGKDRSQLPHDIGTWTPKPNTDVRPGPGSSRTAPIESHVHSTCRAQLASL
ncbi:hypothetical protein AK812_SmicGene41386 [Symbiodinium microadriaticum]|uniref:Uncharacterized protein n=1 Tax=Symbiodinium microadriaticum TaxID=2951 RepID=A0A1Q9C677_SYMMI|nr:hypothetical protein AK812_SmicGene41386 [Symbiodinium microadriaticum]